MFTYRRVSNRLTLDDGVGLREGPRELDGKAGLVRYADETLDLPFSELRAVALLYVERTVWARVGGGPRALVPRMVHVVVLVRSRVPAGAEAVLDALARTDALPRGSSIHTAAAALDACSLPLATCPDAASGRQLAKAAARVAGLPVVELYGELPVHRPAGGLDLCIRDRLERAPPPDPGPPPEGAQVEPGPDGAFVLRVSVTPPSPWLLVSLGGVAVLVSTLLALLASPLALVAIPLAAVALALAQTARKRQTRALVADRTHVAWEGPRGGSVAVEALEMVRVDDGTLILVGQADELRCDLGDPDLAGWAKAAVELALGPRRRGYR